MSKPSSHIKPSISHTPKPRSITASVQENGATLGIRSKISRSRLQFLGQIVGFLEKSRCSFIVSVAKNSKQSVRFG